MLSDAAIEIGTFRRCDGGVGASIPECPDH
jgi:hypothetical protein